MEIQGLAFLPIFLSIWMLLGLCSTTTITVILGHSKYPYISNTGEEFPESVVFTVVFMVISIVGAGIASIKYRFMIIHSEPSEKRHIIGQRLLYAMGWLACIGTALTGAFSMKTNPLVHRISAGVAFFTFAIYNLCQSICLYKRSLSSRCMCHIRLASTLVTIVALIIFAVGLGTFFLLCTTDSCKEIFSITGLVGEWTGFFGLTVYPVMNYTDFQCLSLELSREGISIVLRKKTQDPENPQ
ncbi:DNA damage-regulated autophagy modulator protein 1-like [Bufo gargarizans]|uniref:DNA damage-regulated autophagy modulator protein 1-like n=1 Tax=Bufo gargarizans TaxID=30331 RepID=UPI001CF33B9C|nr:DNA damage-regulated autophagy modulator protein 1-like [Bufo gargarizans]